MNLLKRIVTFFLCLFFTGAVNLALESGMLLNKQNIHATCCCSGAMEDECSCEEGSCCSPLQKTATQLSFNACGGSAATPLQIAAFKFLLVTQPISLLLPQKLHFKDKTTSLKNRIFLSPPDKPPQTLFFV